MSELYLPADHSEADLVLAGQIAERIESAELHVAWTAGAGRAAPEVTAWRREPVSPPMNTPALVVRAIRELWTALLGRDRSGAAARRERRVGGLDYEFASDGDAKP